MRIKIVHSRTWYHGSEKKTAAIMLYGGKLSIEKTAKYLGLEVAEVEQLAGGQTV